MKYLLTLLLALPLFAADGGCPAKWGYGTTNGPDRWGQMETAWAACDSGKVQSPIDLAPARLEPGLPELDLQYGDAPLVVQNTGHEIKVPLGAGTVTFGDKSGELQQFHFHVKSEHTIDSRHAAAELHLVHATADGKLIVVGVLIDEGNENEALKTLLKLRPETICTSRKSQANFNPFGLLPKSTAAYYMYAGSLTTPACSQVVTWIVLRDHIQASHEQIQALEVGHENARPVQPLGTRVVSRNF